ncbi:MAG: helix-turn-helix domain-containing protein [Ruminococcus sp.]|nr:helix-turn-helix domain-containing protein [Ruminococcus sp.]
MLTVRETARVLGESIHTIYRLIELGELTVIKVSPRKTVIKAEEIERYIVPPFTLLQIYMDCFNVDTKENKT